MQADQFIVTLAAGLVGGTIFLRLCGLSLEAQRARARQIEAQRRAEEEARLERERREREAS